MQLSYGSTRRNLRLCLVRVLVCGDTDLQKKNLTFDIVILRFSEIRERQMGFVQPLNTSELPNRKLGR